MPEFWNDESQFNLPSCVVALGTFDGVHRGHQALIRRAQALAAELDTACVVYTFSRSPLSVISPERAPLMLSTPCEKREKLFAMGVDGVLMRDFTPEYAAVEPKEFLEMLAEKLHVRGVVAGFNYSFGAGGRGNADLILAEAARLGYRADIVEPVMDGEDIISSSLLRALKERGETARFERLFRLQ